MAGWMHLPRFIDKIRLHLAGKLHEDYQANFCKAFDGAWLEMAGVNAEQFIDVVKRSITDGEVCDWVLKNVKKDDSVKAAHRARMLNYPGKTTLRCKLASRCARNRLASPIATTFKRLWTSSTRTKNDSRQQLYILAKKTSYCSSRRKEALFYQISLRQEKYSLLTSAATWL
jgi:hypothetical protein